MLVFPSASSSKTKSIKPKDMVDLFCKRVGEVEFDKDTNGHKKGTYIEYTYPRGNSYKDKDGKIYILKNAGFTNGYVHLKSCLAGGIEAVLNKLYQENLELKSMTIGDFFEPICVVTEKEEEIVDWITLIIEE